MRTLAAARGLLARLVPGRAARRAAEFDAAARDAYRTALRVDTAAPLAPAPHVAPVEDEPASADPAVPDAEPTTMEATSPTVAEPPAFVRAAGWASPPPPLTERPVPPRRQPDDSMSVRPRRPKRGETAPDSLLQTPTRVAPIADDFFDSLIREVEGDR